MDLLCYVVLLCKFLRNLPLAFCSGCTRLFIILLTVHEGCHFSTSLPVFVVSWCVDNCHLDRYVPVFHWGLNLHFSDDEWCWTYFHISIGLFYVLFREVSTSSSIHFSIGFFFGERGLCKFLIYFWYLASLVDIFCYSVDWFFCIFLKDFMYFPFNFFKVYFIDYAIAVVPLFSSPLFPSALHPTPNSINIPLPPSPAST